MTETTTVDTAGDRTKIIAALRDSLKQVRRLEAENAKLSAGAAPEPVAIVAASCRFPGGVRTPEQLWDLVDSGTDAIGDFPSDRGWNLDSVVDESGARPHTSYVAKGGFLDDATTFDPAFFGISRREAAAMDPQQRILLELTWEAFERARIDPRSRRGTPVGVWIGTNGQDYLDVLQQSPDEAAGYVGTGSASSVLSGRLSYVFGLVGPSVTIDTACSASLVALHEAAVALRSGECDAALVGGVTVMATPRAFVDFSALRGLAPDGRCKAFAAGADGTVWGEGAAILLLQRLSDARTQGSEVLAVVRGSAVGSDGASAGLTAPSGPSQQRVIRAALAAAGVAPAAVDVVEAHGTGTPLGDPVEAQALLATYGADRAGRGPLLVGSVKSNVGHTQAAAGVAGVLKMVMAMRAGIVPATLHVDRPTESVDWTTGGLALADRRQEWPRHAGDVRRAAVSSFGFSGTNAHVILEQGDPAVASPDVADPGPATVALPMSARSAAGLARVAAALADRVDHLAPGERLVDVAASAATTRAHLPNRAVVVFGATRPQEAATRLRAIAAGHHPAGTVGGVAGTGSLAVLFTGQGSATPTMGRRLYETFPQFRSAFDEVVAELDRHLPQPLTTVMWGEDAQLLARTQWAQPALFAFEVAAYRLAESVGVHADVLIGHSVGELSAIHVSGALSLAEAALLVVTRGQLMGALPPGGGMWAVHASEHDIASHLTGDIGIAAVNAPDAVVISGSSTDAEPVLAALRAAGHEPRQLEVSHAFHSVLMTPVHEDLAAAIRRITLRRSDVRVISTVTGRELDGAQIADPAYWTRQVSAPVRFADAVDTAAATGTSTYLELGPAAVLAPLIPRIVGDRPDVTALAAVRRGLDEVQSTICALAGTWTGGAAVDFSALLGSRRSVDLPTYPFESERCWLDATLSPAVSGAPANTPHPLIDSVVDLSHREISVLTGRLQHDRPGWLADHRVHGAVVVPGTAILDLTLWAGRRVGMPRVAELILGTPITVPEGGIELQLVLAEPIDGRRTVTVTSRPVGSDEWTWHADGAVSERMADDHSPVPATPTGEAIIADVASLYDDLAASGLGYGPTFRVASRIRLRGGAAEVDVTGGVGDTRCVLDPALLDAALHAVGFTTAMPDDEFGRVPFAWTDVEASIDAPAGPLTVTVLPVGDATVALRVADASGVVVSSVGSVSLLPISAADVAPPLHRVDWVAAAGRTSVDLSASPRVLRVTDDTHPAGTAVGDVVAGALRAVQTFLERAVDPEERLIAVVTTGSVPGAAVAGLLRSAATEHPGQLDIPGS